MDAIVLDNRALTISLHWLTVATPALAHAQPGQFAMVRCSGPGSADPHLRQRCWIADADGTATASLLVDRDEPGGGWLAAQLPGAELDIMGPLGHGLPGGGERRATVLLAEGAQAGALTLYARRAAQAGGSVVLLLSAGESSRLPPYVLPPDVEYLATAGDLLSLLDTAGTGGRLDSPLLWADQVIGAGSAATAARLAQRIRRDRFNWKPGFATFILDHPYACGVGLCGGCWHNTRRGDRLLCTAGPALDLRDAI